MTTHLSLPWIHGLPEPEQVAQHAAEHPVAGGIYLYGLWLRVRHPDWSRLPDIVMLRADKLRIVGTDNIGLSLELAKRAGTR